MPTTTTAEPTESPTTDVLTTTSDELVTDVAATTTTPTTPTNVQQTFRTRLILSFTVPDTALTTADEFIEAFTKALAEFFRRLLAKLGVRADAIATLEMVVGRHVRERRETIVVEWKAVFASDLSATDAAAVAAEVSAALDAGVELTVGETAAVNNTPSTQTKAVLVSFTFMNGDAVGDSSDTTIIAVTTTVEVTTTNNGGSGVSTAAASKDSTTGAIVGGAIGGVVVLGLLVVGAIVCFRRKKKARDSGPAWLKQGQGSKNMAQPGFADFGGVEDGAVTLRGGRTTGRASVPVLNIGMGSGSVETIKTRIARGSSGERQSSDGTNDEFNTFVRDLNSNQMERTASTVATPTGEFGKFSSVRRTNPLLQSAAHDYAQLPTNNRGGDMGGVAETSMDTFGASQLSFGGLRRASFVDDAAADMGHSPLPSPTKTPDAPVWMQKDSLPRENLNAVAHGLMSAALATNPQYVVPQSGGGAQQTLYSVPAEQAGWEGDNTNMELAPIHVEEAAEAAHAASDHHPLHFKAAAAAVLAGVRIMDQTQMAEFAGSFLGKIGQDTDEAMPVAPVDQLRNVSARRKSGSLGATDLAAHFAGVTAGYAQDDPDTDEDVLDACGGGGGGGGVGRGNQTTVRAFGSNDANTVGNGGGSSGGRGKKGRRGKKHQTTVRAYGDGPAPPTIAPKPIAGGGIRSRFADNQATRREPLSSSAGGGFVTASSKDQPIGRNASYDAALMLGSELSVLSASAPSLPTPAPRPVPAPRRASRGVLQGLDKRRMSLTDV
jgi:hypothetical protein